ncbi:MAG: permease prefix domain 1-containing protein [Planctomycetota bacterium]
MSQQEFEHYLNLLARMLKLTPKQRDAIADELRTHLEERLDELQHEGHDKNEAIRLALNEFGDANALAADFTHTLRHARRTRTRRRLMQTTAGTLIAAAVVTFAVMTLTPNNFQGTPTQNVTVAQNLETPTAAQTHIEPDQPLTDLEADGEAAEVLLERLKNHRMNINLGPADVREAIRIVSEELGGANLVVMNHRRLAMNDSYGRGDEAEGFGGGREFGARRTQVSAGISDYPITLELRDVPAIEVLDLIREMSPDPISAELRGHALVFRLHERVKPDPTQDWVVQVIDVSPLLRLAAQASPTSNPDPADLDRQLSEHLRAVVQGSRYRDELGAVNSVFGTLTIVGGDGCQRFTQQHMVDLMHRLEGRVTERKVGE